MMKTAIQCLRGLVSAGALAATALLAIGATATRTPAPELSLSLRGLVDDSLEQGEPLRVAVRLESSGEGTGTVELAPSSGTWVDAVAVELSTVGSKGVIVRATAVGAPASPRATLNRGHVAGGLWMFAESSTRGLAPGDYVVRAHLSIKASTGWSGEAISEETSLRVIAISSAPERVSARTLVRAQIAFSANAFEEAARLLDVVLAKNPDDFELLCLRADVALSGGNPLAAMICVNRAASTLSLKGSGPPPLVLHKVQSRVFSARMAGPSPSANPPAWTWPPVSVVALLAKDASKSVESLPGAVSVPVSAPAPTQSSSLSSAITSAPSLPASEATPARAVAAAIGTVVPSTELSDVRVIADAAGQWAAGASAGSQYGQTQYAAAQATGAPNIPLGLAGNSPDAWCPARKTDGSDWLEVTFAQPVHATEVRVRQNNGPGAIVKIEAIEPDGTVHPWWQGVDPFVSPAVREIVWFTVRVPKTSYLVARVKITLNLAAGPEWKQIDAVQLVGSSP